MAVENRGLGTESNPINGSDVPQDLPPGVSCLIVGSPFGVFFAEFAIDPDKVS